MSTTHDDTPQKTKNANKYTQVAQKLQVHVFQCTKQTLKCRSEVELQ